MRGPGMRVSYSESSVVNAALVNIWSISNKAGGTRCGELAGGRWRRYGHGVLLAGRVGLRSCCRRLAPWGSREFGQRPLRWVCHRGRPDVTPELGAMAGICSAPYPGRAPALAWLPGPSTTRERSARRVFTRSDRDLRVATTRERRAVTPSAAPWGANGRPTPGRCHGDERTH